jgi:hypothetical protein
MRTAAIATFLLSGLSLALNWEGAENIPSGQYQGVVLANGSTILQSISNPSLAPITLHLAPDTETSDVIDKRGYQCW